MDLRISSSKTKELAYKAIVRPILEYACTVWDPHNEKQVLNLEKVQRRAARFVLNRHRNTSSVSGMLLQLQWPTLQDRRYPARLTMLHKILNGTACVRCPDLQPMAESGRRRRHDKQLQRIPCRTEYRKQSFFPRTVRDWNDLQPDTVQSLSDDSIT